MAIKKDTLDQLLDGRDPKQVFNKDGLFDELKKALAERVLNAELDDHLESEAPAGAAEPSQRAFEEDRSDRDREALHPDSPRSGRDVRSEADRRYQRRFPGFDEKIVSMYARGM
jgi:putative transposase